MLPWHFNQGGTTVLRLQRDLWAPHLQRECCWLHLLEATSSFIFILNPGGGLNAHFYNARRGLFWCYINSSHRKHLWYPIIYCYLYIFYVLKCLLVAVAKQNIEYRLSQDIKGHLFFPVTVDPGPNTPPFPLWSPYFFPQFMETDHYPLYTGCKIGCIDFSGWEKRRKWGCFQNAEEAGRNLKMAARALDQIQPLNVSQIHSVSLNLSPNNQRVNYWLVKTQVWSLAPSSGLDSPARTPPPHTRMCKSRRMDTSEP